MSLSSGEIDHLRTILRLAHAIERDWPRMSAGLDSKTDRRLGELRARIARLSGAESQDLRRLAKWADHLHEGLSLKHFFALLVPFERLTRRSVRDDEFLVLESDSARGEKPLVRTPLTVVLENIRSAFNVGAVFRTAECFGATEIVLCGYTPDPGDEKTAKTSMGTGSDVSWRRFDRATDAIETLKAAGYTVVALETVQGAETLGRFEFPERTALLLGNERFGVSPDILARADALCRIPLRGRKNSLNVGIAFGIAAAEFDRQWENRHG